MEQNSTTPEHPEAEACHHMERHVKSLAEGTLSGPMLLYTKMHVCYCNKCGPALAALKEQQATDATTEKVAG